MASGRRLRAAGCGRRIPVASERGEQCREDSHPHRPERRAPSAPRRSQRRPSARPPSPSHGDRRGLNSWVCNVAAHRDAFSSRPSEARGAAWERRRPFGSRAPYGAAGRGCGVSPPPVATHGHEARGGAGRRDHGVARDGVPDHPAEIRDRDLQQDHEDDQLPHRAAIVARRAAPVGLRRAGEAAPRRAHAPAAARRPGGDDDHEDKGHHFSPPYAAICGPEMCRNCTCCPVPQRFSSGQHGKT